MAIAEPYPEGTLVHHRGAIHSVGHDPASPNGGLRGGWATVLCSKPGPWNSYEYEVLADRYISGLAYADGGKTTWWNSDHINRALPAAI